MKRSLSIGILALALAAFGIESFAAAPNKPASEDYVHAPLPPGVQVVSSEYEGPLFADMNGKTLYTWRQHAMRVGFAGDPAGKSLCEDKPTLKTIGGASPYPPGLDLPEADKRLACTALYPPLLANAEAKPVDRWTVITRSDGKKQWAYDNYPVYTYIYDRRPGDTNGGASEHAGGAIGELDMPKYRNPIGPPPNVPPGFLVITTVNGRMVVNAKRYPVYTSDRDAPNKSNCTAECLGVWNPMLAPEAAQPQGEWSIFERAPGVRQWAFRKKPVYSRIADWRPRSQDWAREPGWHNLMTQPGPRPPAEFTQQITYLGDVLADAQGRTIYVYNCGDEGQDQQLCNTMESPQVYRIAVAGGGNWDRALKTWRYVVAGPTATSPSQTWSIVYVDPATGHRAQPGQAGALRVWAWQDKPVYTYAGDQAPGDVEGHGIGQWEGARNGFRAFFLHALHVANES